MKEEATLNRLVWSKEDDDAFWDQDVSTHELLLQRVGDMCNPVCLMEEAAGAGAGSANVDTAGSTSQLFTCAPWTLVSDYVVDQPFDVPADVGDTTVAMRSFPIVLQRRLLDRCPDLAARLFWAHCCPTFRELLSTTQCQLDMWQEGLKREGAVVHECLKAIHGCGRNPGVVFPVAVFDVGDDNVPSIGVNCDPLTLSKQGKSGAEVFFLQVHII